MSSFVLSKFETKKYIFVIGMGENERRSCLVCLLVGEVLAPANEVTLTDVLLPPCGFWLRHFLFGFIPQFIKRRTTSARFYLRVGTSVFAREQKRAVHYFLIPDKSANEPRAYYADTLNPNVEFLLNFPLRIFTIIGETCQLQMYVRILTFRSPLFPVTFHFSFYSLLAPQGYLNVFTFIA